MPIGPYSLTVISTEQKNVHGVLSRLQQCLHHSFWKKPEGIDLGSLKNMFRKFIQLDQYCRARKLEVYVIPAIRRATTEVDDLLTQLDSISAHSVHMLLYAYDQMQSALVHGMVSVKALFSAFEVYCKNLSARLTKEENELFPIARRVLSSNEWSAITEKCCVDNGKKIERRNWQRVLPDCNNTGKIIRSISQRKSYAFNANARKNFIPSASQCGSMNSQAIFSQAVL